MAARSRRLFLRDVGRGMIVATIGPSLATDLRFTSAFGEDGEVRVSFGGRDRLVDMLQSTPADQMLSLVVREIRQGTSLKELVASAALANARAFAGEDYVGFHTLMALRPALSMSEELTGPEAALPVLKVLYRNSSRIQEAGVSDHDGLQFVSTGGTPSGQAAEIIRDAVHRGDRAAAERALTQVAAESPSRAFNDLLTTVEEGAEVHRVVLASRAWDMISLVGEENAAALLRQSLRYCLKNEESSARNFADIRSLLPKLMDQYGLENRAWGTKSVDDGWLQEALQTLWTSTPEQAAEFAAAALVEGICPPKILEAISLATNQLVLCDEGRPKEWAQPNKPVGSVHGDSIGVHASDTAHAWGMIATASDAPQRNAAIVLAAWNAAKDRSHRNAEFAKWQPRPWPEHLEQVVSTAPDTLLQELRTAIENNDQPMACAVTARYGELRGDAKPVFSMLREYATTQDGALHGEKYYFTVQQNFATSTPANRWKHVVALARVTASEYGRPAPGFEEAKGLINT